VALIAALVGGVLAARGVFGRFKEPEPGAPFSAAALFSGGVREWGRGVGVVTELGEGLAKRGDCFCRGLGELELTMLPAPGLVVPAS